jgi:hypothetical protein
MNLLKKVKLYKRRLMRPIKSLMRKELALQNLLTTRL